MSRWTPRSSVWSPLELARSRCARTQTPFGVEETVAPTLIRVDRVSIGEDGAAVHVGQTVIHLADDAYITPGEARRLAEALVELAEYAVGLR